MEFWRCHSDDWMKYCSLALLHWYDAQIPTMNLYFLKIFYPSTKDKISVLNFAGRVPSLVYSHRAILPWSVFRGSKMFPCGYFVSHKFVLVGTSWISFFSRRNFVGPKYIFAGLSWVPIFSPWVVCGWKGFPRGYFVDPRFFLVGNSWVQVFFRYFVGLKYFLVDSKFSLVGNFVNLSCWPHEKKCHRNISETAYSIPNWF